MAKDGTFRGNRSGNLTGAGRKPPPLADQIAQGKRNLTVMDLPEPADLPGADVPPPKEYMRSRQKDGSGLQAEEIYNATWRWLQRRGCEKHVTDELVAHYAQTVARWIQCEEAISAYGFLSRHPTTNAPIASPFVSMSQQFMKQASFLWHQLYCIVQANCTTAYSGDPDPQNDVMERLLRAREPGRKANRQF